LNWKTPITLVVLLGLLVGAVFYGWQTIISPDEKEKAPEVAGTPPKCERRTTFKKGQTIRAPDITVNVYNAGIVPGLAGDTLSALVGKGFQGGISDNAPGAQSARNVTIVTDVPESPKVRLVRTQFQGPVRVVPGELAVGVDVIVGDEFLAVDPNAITFIQLKRNISSCPKGKPGSSP
jgi:hypothetical protein